MPFEFQARQKSHYPFKKRLRYYLSRLAGTRLQKSQKLLFVTMNGRRFKRLVLRDSHLAAEIERNLEHFGSSEHFPPMITRYEHEIWVEYVAGSAIREVDADIVAKVADLYAAIYARRPRRVAVAETPFPDRLQRDLRFLNQMGVLTDDAYRDLEAFAARSMPPEVWIGFDYTDPVLKNFVIARESGRACAVDVESLLDGQLIGTGVAKACVRWLEPFREVFFDHLIRPEVPDFHTYFPYVELCFLATWTKMGFLEQKWKYVDSGHFDRFRGAPGSSDP